MRTLDTEFLKAARERFADRMAVRSSTDGPAASVTPFDAAEVEFLAGLAARHRVELSAVGAGTGGAPSERGGYVEVRFEQMRAVVMPGPRDFEVELEPGVSWLELEDRLRGSGKSLRVYPTSAPRATVGGWLAQDGLGVGSFRYDWLGENVASAEVVLPGGGRRLFEGDDLGLVVGAEGATGIIVRATLRLRESGRDLPFAAAFDDPDSLSRAVSSIQDKEVPLWHLGFSNPLMTFAGRARGAYLLFGAYPDREASETRHLLNRLIAESGGSPLPTVDAYRSWGERFFPARPSGPVPYPGRALVPTAGLPEALRGLRSAGLTVSGSVARSGEVLLLAFLPGNVRSRPASIGEENAKKLLDIARSAGGREYDAVPKRRGGDASHIQPHREA